MSDGSKESKPRPSSTEYERMKQNNTGVDRPEYYDVLTTEECFDFEVANNIVLGYN
jgi:hypothetical protein